MAEEPVSELSVWDRAARIAGEQGSIVTVDHILAALAGEDAESEPSQTWDQSAALVRARSTDDDPVTIGRWVSVLGQPVGKKIVPPVAPVPATPVIPVTPGPDSSGSQDTAVATPTDTRVDVSEAVHDIQQAVNEAANGLPPARTPVSPPAESDETLLSMPDEPRIVDERQLQVEDAAAQMRAISAEIRAELEHVNEDYLRLTKEHEALTHQYQRALQQNEDRKRLTGFTADDASFLVEAIRRHKRTIYDNGGEEEKADAELYLSLEDITGQSEGPD